MPRKFKTLTAGTLAAWAAFALLVVPAGGSVAQPGVQVISDERGCTELAYNRPGMLAAVRPLVPARYTLQQGASPDRTPVQVNEISCDAVTLDGHPTGSAGGPTTTVIVSALFTAIDGSPARGGYVLDYTTDNGVVFAAYQQLGWPATFLGSPVTFLVSALPDGADSISLDVAHGKWEHAIDAMTTTPLSTVGHSTATFRHDTHQASLQLCYDNNTARRSVILAGDLSRTPLASLTPAPAFTAANGAAFTGGWSASLGTDPCPAI